MCCVYIGVSYMHVCCVCIIKCSWIHLSDGHVFITFVVCYPRGNVGVFTLVVMLGFLTKALCLVIGCELWTNLFTWVGTTCIESVEVSLHGIASYAYFSWVAGCCVYRCGVHYNICCVCLSDMIIMLMCLGVVLTC